MRLDSAEFLDRYRAGALRMALVGMANVGKSCLAARLAESKALAHYCVDEEMAKEGPTVLSGHDGPGDGATVVSPAHQRENLAREARCMTELLDACSGNSVLDTTGSLVHLPSDLLVRLRERFLVVYLRVAPGFESSMVDQYLDQPTGMFWGPFYRPSDGESQTDAVRRCYPELLAWRAGRYRDLADVTVDNRKDGRYLTAEEAWSALLAGLEHAGGAEEP